MSCSTDGGTRSEIVEEESERGREGGEEEETGEKDEDSGRAESATRRQI